MYLPPVFAESDPAVLYALMRRHAFALLVMPGPPPEAAHLPLHLATDEDDAGARILGHVAAANPLALAFDGATEALAVFQGPHAYISPSWYASAQMVPTWNYAAVHAYGRPRVVDEPARVRDMLACLVTDNEDDATGNWSMARLDDDFGADMMKGIVAFEMPVERLEGKLKMSQNRQPDDVAGAMAGLERQGDPESAAVAAMMARCNAGR